MSMRAQVPAAGKTIAAAAADHVAFAADYFAGMKIIDVRANRHDLAHEFVPDRHGNRNGGARPIVPLINVKIGAADTGFQNPNQDVVDANGGLRYIGQPESGACIALNQRFQDSFPSLS